MPLPDIDEHGIVRSGPFAGLKAEEVFAFAEATASSRRESGETNEPPAPTPADKLKAAADARTSPMNQFTFAQFEKIDEDNFSRTVPDYDKYKDKILSVKKTMSPDQRAQQGVHKFIYQNVRMEDPEVQKVIFGTIPPPGEKPPKVDDDGNPIVPETPPENAAPPPTPEDPKPPAAPRPAPKPVPPPVAKPTPRSAGVPAAAATPKPTLKATPKVIALAERYSMTIDEYLGRLEEQGYTQEQLNNLSLPSSARATPSSRPRSIYDR
jgi:hypothetical protein